MTGAVVAGIVAVFTCLTVGQAFTRATVARPNVIREHAVGLTG